MVTSDRYDRQSTLVDQNALKDSEVAYIGDCHILFTGAAVLGQGNMKIYTDKPVKRSKEDFLYFRSEEGESGVGEIKKMLKIVNDDVHVETLGRNIEYDSDVKRIGKPDIIVDVTNDPCSKQLCLDYAIEIKRPFISASFGKTHGKFFVFYGDDDYFLKYYKEDEEKFLFAKYEGLKQGAVLQTFFSGMILNEITGILMKDSLKKDREKLRNIIYYDMNIPTRFIHYPFRLDDEQAIAKYNLELSESLAERESRKKLDYEAKIKLSELLTPYINKKAYNPPDIMFDKYFLNGGCGALGNGVPWLAATFVKRITNVDFDTISITNCNRQIFFPFAGIEKIERGELKKAEVLTNILKEIAPENDIDYIDGKIDLEFEETLKRRRPDLISSNVDKQRYEALINFYAKKFNIPGIYGGTEKDERGRIAVTYKEGPCLNDQVHVDNSAMDFYQRQLRTRGCVFVDNSSIVNNVLVVSGLMGGEIPSLLRPDIYKRLDGVIQYDSEFISRIGLRPVVPVCSCEGEEKWMEKMKVLYQ